jgi:hypothetical protein
MKAIVIEHTHVSYQPIHNDICHSLWFSALVPGYQHPYSNLIIIAFVVVSPA